MCVYLPEISRRLRFFCYYELGYFTSVVFFSSFSSNFVAVNNVVSVFRLVLTLKMYRILQMPISSRVRYKLRKFLCAYIMQNNMQMNFLDKVLCLNIQWHHVTAFHRCFDISGHFLVWSPPSLGSLFFLWCHCIRAALDELKCTFFAHNNYIDLNCVVGAFDMHLFALMLKQLQSGAVCILNSYSFFFLLWLKSLYCMKRHKKNSKSEIL